MTKRLAALIVCLVVAVAFVLRMRNPAALAMDAPGLHFFHGLENRVFTAMWNVVSWLGSILFVGPLAIYLARRAVRWSRADAWALVLSAIGASLVHSAIKMSLPRARPTLYPMLGPPPTPARDRPRAATPSTSPRRSSRSRSLHRGCGRSARA
jgi:hypothetical protein